MGTMPFSQNRRSLTAIFGFAIVMMLLLLLRTNHASAAACTAPATDYGSVTNTGVGAAGGGALPAGTYKIWTRMVAADTTNNSYLLEVDGTSCYVIGGSSVQTYTTAQDTANTRFSTSTTDTTDWIGTTTTGTATTITFSTAGTHTLKLIGNASGVVVDRVILTQDTSCQPIYKGDNCAPPPDITAPAVGITSPVANANVSGTITVTVNATDDSGAVKKVELYKDSDTTPLNTLMTSVGGVFSFTGINTSTWTVGVHTLKAIAYDNSTTGNPASTTVAITVKDSAAPTGVALTLPAAGSTQGSTMQLTATATDNVAVTRVDFFVDTNPTVIGTSSTVNAFSTSYVTTGLTNAVHKFRAVAYDAAGNSTPSADVSVTIFNAATPPADTTPPTVSILAPLDNTIISNDLTNNTHFNSGAVTVGAVAADASGTIKQVVLYVDNNQIKTLTTAPFTFAYSTTALTCGTHTFKAVATDSSTNANTAQATTTFKIARSADINGDCAVNYLDLGALAGVYNKTGVTFGRSDINLDGKVDFLDLGALAQQYGK